MIERELLSFHTYAISGISTTSSSTKIINISLQSSSLLLQNSTKAETSRPAAITLSGFLQWTWNTCEGASCRKIFRQILFLLIMTLGFCIQAVFQHAITRLEFAMDAQDKWVPNKWDWRVSFVFLSVFCHTIAKFSHLLP